ncbi:hypothetical protein QL285_057491 [Trifolium repens]|nr:hypothetical protein QL285_057491 [Trifolium repens]
MKVEKEERVEDSLELMGEIVEDSFEKIQAQEYIGEAEVSSKIPKNPDLNEDADYEFDLNKFPEEEEEKSSQHIEIRRVIRMMLKIILPKFMGEIVEDSFEKIQEQEYNGEAEVSSKIPKNFDLNEDTNYEFDLNKFPEEEEEESSQHIEIQRVIRMMLKIILPKFD